MKKPLLVILVMFLFNFLLIGILKNCIKRDGNELLTVQTIYSAHHTRHTQLLRDRQDLARRDRIVSYAQNYLHMRLLQPDEIASGDVVKIIIEEEARNNIIYTFIDFITPTLNAVDLR